MNRPGPSLRILPACLLASLVGGASASADIVTFPFTATVTSKSELNGTLPFGVGAPVVGSFSYDDSAPLSSVAAGQSYFDGVSIHVQSLVAGLYSYSQSYVMPIYPDVLPGENGIVIGPYGANHQQFSVATHSRDTAAVPTKRAELDVLLVGTTGFLSSTTSLAGLSLDLSKLDWSLSTLSYLDQAISSGPNPVRFQLAFTATLAPPGIVPEPSALLLSGIGLVGLLACVRKGRVPLPLARART